MNFLDKCLFNLSAIGEVPKGQKISTREEYLTAEKESVIPQWMKRFADGRLKVFRDINKYVSTAIEVSTRIMESKYFVNEYLYSDNAIADPMQNDNNASKKRGGAENKSVNHDILRVRAVRIDELKRSYSGLLDARRGIVGQQETYKGDTDAAAAIRDLTTKIDSHCVEIKKFLLSIGEKID